MVLSNGKHCRLSQEEITTEGDKLAHRILDEGENVPLNDEQSCELPEWFDVEKFKRGQAYVRENYYCNTISNLCGLIMVLAVPSILRVLIQSKQSSKPFTAYKRYFATILHVLNWFEGDITNPKSSLYKSLLTVKSFHSKASKHSARTSSRKISQKDMVLTQFGFIGPTLVYPHHLGMTTDEKGIEGLMHFWRVIGYLLGIQDKFNLCHENPDVTNHCCKVIMDEFYHPAIKNASQEFHTMKDAMLDGVWAISPTINTEVFYNYFLYVIGLPHEKMSSKSLQRKFDAQVYITGVLLNNRWQIVVRPILNFVLWSIINFSKIFPIFGYIAFWDEMRNIKSFP